MKTADDTQTRPYRQTARAAAAEATSARILDAFTARLATHWFDEVTLEMLARDAGVTVQTVIRRFGGKDGLLDPACRIIDRQFGSAQALAPPNAAAFIAGLIGEYESVGPLVLRLLAQEDRYPAIRRLTDFGRASHRRKLSELFAPRLASLVEESACIDALVVATDVYVWKLIRIDMHRSIPYLQQQMHRMVAAALGADPSDPLTFSPKE